MKSGAYESELTRFIRELRDRNPQIAEQQKKNRATWWDRPQDLQTWRERSAATVPQPAYVYFPLPQKKGDDPDSVAQVSTPSRNP